jgi:hypothetical protein
MDFEKLFSMETDHVQGYSNPLDKILRGMKSSTMQQTNDFSVYANEQLINVAIPEFFDQKKIDELVLIAEGKNKIINQQLVIMYDETVLKARQKLYELVGPQKYQEYADIFVAADVEFIYPRQSRKQSSLIHFQYTGKKVSEKKEFDFTSIFTSGNPIEFGNAESNPEQAEIIFDGINQNNKQGYQEKISQDDYDDYQIIDEQPNIETKNIEFNKAVSKMIDKMETEKNIIGLRAIIEGKPQSVEGGDLELSQETIDKAKSALEEITSR